MIVRRDEEPRIATGSVYRPPDVPYKRVLVMRRWPRGVRKTAVDRWLRDLGPSDALLEKYNAGGLEWREFARRYRAEMRSQRALIAELARLASESGVVLLCGSHPEEECHRSLLAAMVRRARPRARPEDAR